MVVNIRGILQRIYLAVTFGACPPIWVAWVHIVIAWIAVHIVGTDIGETLLLIKAYRGLVLGPHNLSPGDKPGSVLGFGQH